MNEWKFWQREIATMKYEKKETKTHPELLVEGGCAAAGHDSSPYQQTVRSSHSEKKRNLIGLGGGNYKGSGHENPSFERSLSAPAGFGALEEDDVEEDKLIPKKGKILIKIKAKGHDKRDIEVLEEI